MNLLYTHQNGDPYNLHHYTLSNGLQLYLSPRPSFLRVEARVVVRVGSIDETEEESGLSHVLEHMMFKGTTEIGTLDSPRENALLSKMSSLLEKIERENEVLKNSPFSEEFNLNWQKSDALAIPGELDRLYAQLGAQEVNAYTSYAETAYSLSLPKEALNFWIQLERKRFSDVRFRQYLNELNVIYDEFNQEIDDDYAIAFNEVLRQLFGGKNPIRPILGQEKSLQKPSLKRLENFYHKYYVPNNMALFLCGDFDHLAVFESFEKNWSDWKSNSDLTFPQRNLTSKLPTQPLKIEQTGQESPFLLKAFPLVDLLCEEQPLLNLSETLLNNEMAGILESQINYDQKALFCETYLVRLGRHSVLFFYAEPRPGDSLEELDHLVEESFETLLHGDFSPEVLKGSLKVLLQERALEGESLQRVESFIDGFSLGYSWQEMQSNYKKLDSLTQEDVTRFLQSRFKSERSQRESVTLYKRRGTESLNPSLTPFTLPEPPPLSLSKESEWAKEFIRKFSQEVPLDYHSSITFSEIDTSLSPNLTFLANRENSLFLLIIRFPIGYLHEPRLDLLEFLFPWITSEQRRGFSFKERQLSLGCEMNFRTMASESLLQIEGEAGDFEEIMELLSQKWNHPYLESDRYSRSIQNFIHTREEAIFDRYNLRERLHRYSLYRESCQGVQRIKNSKLEKIPLKEIFLLIKKLTRSHSIQAHLFAPPQFSPQKNAVKKEANLFRDSVLRFIQGERSLGIQPQKKKIAFLKRNLSHSSFQRDRLLWSHYEMGSIDVAVTIPFGVMNLDEMGFLFLFNEYMGSGINSLVFNEIRERRGICYSAAFSLSFPRYAGEPLSLTAQSSVSPEKLDELLSLFYEWMANLPRDLTLFESGKESLLRQMASQEISARYLESYRRGQYYLGLKEGDTRLIFESVREISFESLRLFFHRRVSNSFKTMTMVGDAKKILPLFKPEWGRPQEVSLEELYPWNS